MTHIPENMAKVAHRHNCRHTRITGKGISFTGGERAEIAGGQGGSSERLRRGLGAASARIRVFNLNLQSRGGTWRQDEGGEEGGRRKVIVQGQGGGCLTGTGMATGYTREEATKSSVGISLAYASIFRTFALPHGDRMCAKKFLSSADAQTKTHRCIRHKELHHAVSCDILHLLVHCHHADPVDEDK